MRSPLLLVLFVSVGLLPRFSCGRDHGTGEAPASDSSVSSVAPPRGLITESINAILTRDHAADKRRWDGIAEAVVSELKAKLVFPSCLPGLRVATNEGKKSLTLFRGEITGYKHLYQSNDAKVLSDMGGSTAVFQMNIRFKDLLLDYYYVFISSPFFSVRKKEGPAKFQLKGVTSVSVVVEHRKPARADPHTEQQLCQLHVRKFKIKQMGHTLKVVSIRSSAITWYFYFFMKYFSPTVRGVTATVSAVECQIKRQVEHVVEELLGTAMKELAMVCSVKQKWTPKDCSYIHDLGTWE